MPEVNGHEKRLLLISNSTLYGGGYLDVSFRIEFCGVRPPRLSEFLAAILTGKLLAAASGATGFDTPGAA